MLAARGVPPCRTSQGLAKGGVDDVHAPLHAVELLRAAARGSEKTGRMTLQVQAIIWSEKQTTYKIYFFSIVTSSMKI